MSNTITLLHEINPRIKNLGILFYGQYIHKVPRPKIPKEHHGRCFEILYLVSGMQPYYVFNQANSVQETVELYQLCGGDVFITQPYEYHSSGQFEQLRGTMYWIHIDSESPTLLNHTKEYSDILKERLRSIDKHLLRVPQSTSRRFIEAFDLLVKGDEISTFRACELLSLFILEISVFSESLPPKAIPKQNNHSLGSRAISFIQSNLLNPKLNVQAIADHLHYSRAYVMTSFRDEIGMTLHEFILRSKVEYACELMKDHSIIETAFLLNFSSSQHFSRVFKEQVNLTPKEYVHKILRLQQNGEQETEKED